MGERFSVYSGPALDQQDSNCHQNHGDMNGYHDNGYRDNGNKDNGYHDETLFGGHDPDQERRTIHVTHRRRGTCQSYRVDVGDSVEDVKSRIQPGVRPDQQELRTSCGAPIHRFTPELLQQNCRERPFVHGLKNRGGGIPGCFHL